MKKFLLLILAIVVLAAPGWAVTEHNIKDLEALKNLALLA